MQNYLLMGSNEVILENDEVMTLKYYLMKEIRQYARCALYGIKIEKVLQDSNMSEVEQVGAISFSQEVVEKIINQLIKNIVTPISMVETIDEFITKEL